MFEIVDRREVRDNLIERVDVLNKVKALDTLGGTDFLTVDLASQFYEVDFEVIKKTIQNHREELETDGLKYLTGKEIKVFLEGENCSLSNHRGYFEVDGNKVSNSKNTLISQRALLRIGMLLRDSKVAQQVRSLLLDNHYQLDKVYNDLKEGNAIEVDKTNPYYFINKEKELLEIKNEIQDKIYECEKSRNIKQARRLLLDLEDINDELIELEKERVKLFEAKANKYDKFLDNEGLTTIEDFSKALAIKKLGRNNMYKFLRDNGYLQDNKESENHNCPYQKYVESGLFKRVRSGSYEVGDGTVKDTYKTYITSKGIDVLISKIEEELKINIK